MSSAPQPYSATDARRGAHAAHRVSSEQGSDDCEQLFTQQAEGPSLASSATEPDQQALLTLLGAETHTVEACATALGWQMERCLSGLVALEVAGKVARAPHGYCALP